MGFAFTLAFFSIIISIAAVIGGIALIGIILMIVYLVQRNQKKKRGETTSKVPLITGIVFLSLAVLLVIIGVIVLAVMFSA